MAGLVIWAELAAKDPKSDLLDPAPHPRQLLFKAPDIVGEGLRQP